jgi:purine-binding chemotaxis protein CheW
MTNAAESANQAFVTVILAGQLFGLELSGVRDVFVPRKMSPVPLAPSEIAGRLNVRGRVVTAIDLRRRLGLAPQGQDVSPVAIGIERHGELYGLIVDRVGDVLRLPASSFEKSPPNLDRNWASVCSGVYRLDDSLMMVLDMEKVLELRAVAGMAA